MVKHFNNNPVRNTSVNQFGSRRITRTQVKPRRNQPSVKKQEIYDARSEREEERSEIYNGGSLATTEEFYKDLAQGCKTEIEILVSHLTNGEDFSDIERKVIKIKGHVRRHLPEFKRHLEDGGNSLYADIERIEYSISEKRWSQPLFDEILDPEDSKYFDMAEQWGYGLVA